MKEGRVIVSVVSHAQGELLAKRLDAPFLRHAPQHGRYEQRNRSLGVFIVGIQISVTEVSRGRGSGTGISRSEHSVPKLLFMFAHFSEFLSFFFYQIQGSSVHELIIPSIAGMF
jgi:hypothetical protein